MNEGNGVKNERTESNEGKEQSKTKIIEVSGKQSARERNKEMRMLCLFQFDFCTR
jgi:hypothetical protein